MAEDIRSIGSDEAPIDYLAPDSPQHARMLQHIKARILFSEEKMSQFHARWRANELLLQAYIGLNDYDALLKNMNDKRGGPGVAVEINVPFAWATVNTIVTYLFHMFGGRNPIFTIGSYRPEQVMRAKHMEMLIQYGCDYTKFLRTLYFFLMDAETYGVAIVRTMWKRELRTSSILVPPSAEQTQLFGSFGMTAESSRVEREYVSFEGNQVTNIDPFLFFPDPRVPMHEVNEKGEWVAWRNFVGKFALLKAEAKGQLKHVKKASKELPVRNNESSGSARGMRALGSDSNDTNSIGTTLISPNYQVDQGTFEIVPKDFGLGHSEIPEKWIFMVLNESQIVQALKLDLPSGKHPVEVSEPNSVGYSFGQLGTVDMLGPLQQMMSWFMNSHIYNVRSAMNNQFVVDPTKVEMSDLTNPEPGKLIRLKNTAFGLADPKSAIFQLPVQDVTRSHINDFQLFGRLAGDLSGASDNVRGLQDTGGRKTATEIRTSSEAGTSRLAAKGKIHSAMAFTGLAQQHTMNLQTMLSEEVELSVLGQDAQRDTVRITPDSIQGDFYFPVHDGTLPIDKIGMLDVWKEIFLGVQQDPELRQTYDLGKIFEWLAQLGGAQNINNFKMNVVGQSQQQDALSSGQGVPLDAALNSIAGMQR